MTAPVCGPRGVPHRVGPESERDSGVHQLRIHAAIDLQVQADDRYFFRVHFGGHFPAGPNFTGE